MTKKSKFKATVSPAALNTVVTPPSFEGDIREPVKSRRAAKKPRRGKIKLPRGTAWRSRPSGKASSLFRQPGRGRAVHGGSWSTSKSAHAASDSVLPAGDATAANDQAVHDADEPGEAHSTGEGISVEVRRDSLAVVMPVDAEVTWESLTAEFFTWNERGVESAVKQGFVILQGRAKDHPGGRAHGQFGPWLVEKLGLGKNVKAALWKAGMFMRIAQHHIISDQRYWRCLPGAYRTLWELTHIPEEILVRLINEGRVHHDLSRREAERLKKEVLGDQNSDGEESDHELSNDAPESELPVPRIPGHAAVLLKAVTYFVPPNVLRRVLRSHEGVSDFPSNSELDAAVQWAKEEHSRMRGGR